MFAHCRAKWLKMEEKEHKQSTRKGKTDSKACSKIVFAGDPIPKRDKSPLEGKESGDSQPSGVKRGASNPADVKTEKKKEKVESPKAFTEVWTKKKNSPRKIRITESS